VEGAMLGVLGISEARELAQSQGLDLIEVSPNANPPVCKIMGFGKYKYNEQKKKSQNTSVSKKMKEIKLGVNIGSHDFSVKIDKVKDFLTSGHLVRFVIRMRGRELNHRDVGYALMKKIVDSLSDVAKLHDKFQYSGNRIIAVFIGEVTK
jgi:translation initiation factor IF-3